MVLSLETRFLQAWAPEFAVPAHQSSPNSDSWAWPSASLLTAQTPRLLPASHLCLDAEHSLPVSCL